MKRYLIILKGRVQGVGLRYIAQKKAVFYKLSGYIQNLPNGDVRIEAQGEKVDDFLNDLLNTKGYLRIDDYAIKEINTQIEKGFKIRY